jgi:hypothetical protein
MDFPALEQAQHLVETFGGNKDHAKKAVKVVINQLSDLNAVKMCQFHDEIDYWNTVLEKI